MKLKKWKSFSEGKSYLDGSGESGFSLTEVKAMNVGDKITFEFNNSLMDGEIVDKEDLPNGDTIFTIETEKGPLKKSHRQLKVYKTY
jgi:hypothetical protein